MEQKKYQEFRERYYKEAEESLKKLLEMPLFGIGERCNFGL